MSLINQMLMDLDARRVDAGGVNPFGGQVRAVPARRGIHPAWWVALGLGLALAGTLAWIALRPAPPQVQPARVNLPLRLESDLQALPAVVESSDEGVPQADAQAVEPDAAWVPEPMSLENVPQPARAPQEASNTPEPPAPAVAPKTEALKAEVSQVQVPKADAPKVAAPEAKRAREGAPVKAPAPEPVKAAEARDAVTDEASAASAREPVIAKQVQPLTPQQQAENVFRMGVLALQQGHKSDAQGRFEQALRLDPGHAAARQSLIAVLIDDGRTGEALQHARAGVELDPRQVGLAMILARLQMERGDVGGALESLENARPHASGRTDFIAFHAALLQRAGRHAEAAGQYLQALRQAPQNGVWWMGLGISLQAEGRKEEALEAFQRAKDSNALSPELAAFVDQRLAQLKGEDR